MEGALAVMDYAKPLADPAVAAKRPQKIIVRRPPPGGGVGMRVIQRRSARGRSASRLF